jgi:hypothetical protein
MFLRNVGIQRTKRRYITEDSSLHNHRCENLKHYNSSIIACVFVAAVTFLQNCCLATMGRGRYAYRHQGDLILFFQNKESRLKIGYEP